MYALSDHVAAPLAGSTTWVAISLASIVMNLSALLSPRRLKSLSALRTDLVAGVTLAVRDGLVATTPVIVTMSSNRLV